MVNVATTGNRGRRAYNVQEGADAHCGGGRACVALQSCGPADHSRRGCPLTARVRDADCGHGDDLLQFARVANARQVTGLDFADIFATNMASTTKLATMILPQLERGTHGVTVAGMMFFDDNVYCLRAGDPVGERLAKVAAAKGMLT